MYKIFFSFLLIFFSLTCNAQENNIDDLTVYSVDKVDKEAVFPGDAYAFHKTVMKNYRIPEIKSGNYIIMTTFIIEKDGSISDIKVTNKVDDLMAAEAIRVIQSVKQKWIPAVKNGNTVRTLYKFPITINIK